MLLAGFLPHFHSLPLLPINELCPFRYCPDADSWVGGFVYVLEPHGPSNRLSCETDSFSHGNPHRFLQSEVFRLYFPSLTPWVVQSLLLPSCSSSLSSCECGTAQSTSCHLACLVRHCLAACPLCPGFPSPTLLPLWVTVSSLTPWLSDFLTVRFFGTSGCFWFLIWLLSFFGCARK